MAATARRRQVSACQPRRWAQPGRTELGPTRASRAAASPPGNARSECPKIGMPHELVESIRHDLSVDWTRREDAEARVRAKIKRLLRRNRDKLTKPAVSEGGAGPRPDLDYYTGLILDSSTVTGRSAPSPVELSKPSLMRSSPARTIDWRRTERLRLESSSTPASVRLWASGARGPCVGLSTPSAVSSPLSGYLKAKQSPCRSLALHCLRRSCLISMSSRERGTGASASRLRDQTRA